MLPNTETPQAMHSPQGSGSPNVMVSPHAMRSPQLMGSRRPAHEVVAGHSATIAAKLPRSRPKATRSRPKPPHECPNVAPTSPQSRPKSRKAGPQVVPPKVVPQSRRQTVAPAPLQHRPQVAPASPKVAQTTPEHRASGERTARDRGTSIKPATPQTPNTSKAHGSNKTCGLPHDKLYLRWESPHVSTPRWSLRRMLLSSGKIWSRGGPKYWSRPGRDFASIGPNLAEVAPMFSA